MKLEEAIRKRRSIRKYKNEPVSERQIRKIIEAGMNAPSAGNLQSRYFYIVADRELKEALAVAAYDQEFVSEAPVAIVVCADLRIGKDYGSRGVNLYAPMDCAASIQNMLLTAHAHGLGTCWVGAFDESKVAEIIDVPDDLRPVAIIPIGVPAESPRPPSRLPLDEVCEFV
jgi:nitroreductase